MMTANFLSLSPQQVSGIPKQDHKQTQQACGETPSNLWVLLCTAKNDFATSLDLMFWRIKIICNKKYEVKKKTHTNIGLML